MSGWLPGWAAALSLGWQGEAHWDLILGDIAVDSKLYLSFTHRGWDWGVVAKHTSGIWEELAFNGQGELGLGTISWKISFDPQTPSFSFAHLKARGSMGAYMWEGIARLEGEGWGAGLKITGTGILRRLALRFNLQRYGEEVLGETFSFSYGSLYLKLPSLCCGGPTWIGVDWAKSGFEGIRISIPLPKGLFGKDCPLYFSLAFTCKPDTAETKVNPGIWIDTPQHVLLFASPEWKSNTFEGLKVYGIGLRLKTGALSLESITSFAKGEIKLVKEPYWEMLRLRWGVEGCCGEDAMEAVFYFGRDRLFSLGEVDLAASARLMPGVKLGGGLEFPVSKAPRLKLSWELTFP